METHNANSDKEWFTTLSVCPFEITVFAQFFKELVPIRETRNLFITAL
jgi:hypothetical protein